MFEVLESLRPLIAGLKRQQGSFNFQNSEPELCVSTSIMKQGEAICIFHSVH
jgi:hypothetical protein